LLDKCSGGEYIEGSGCQQPASTIDPHDRLRGKHPVRKEQRKITSCERNSKKYLGTLDYTEILKIYLTQILSGYHSAIVPYKYIIFYIISNNYMNISYPILSTFYIF